MYLGFPQKPHSFPFFSTLFLAGGHLFPTFSWLILTFPGFSCGFLRKRVVLHTHLHNCMCKNHNFVCKSTVAHLQLNFFAYLTEFLVPAQDRHRIGGTGLKRHRPFKTGIVQAPSFFKPTRQTLQRKNLKNQSK